MEDALLEQELVEVWEDAYEKGMCLALWRLHDFLLLYEELQGAVTPPVKVRIVDEAESDPGKKAAHLSEAKLNATFLIGFSALEALVHSLANLAVLINCATEDSSLSEDEINLLLEEKKFRPLKDKLSQYPSLLSKLLGDDEYTLNKDRHREWQYLLSAIKIRDAIVHARVKFDENYEVTSQVFVPENELGRLLKGYVWLLAKILSISEIVEEEYKRFKRLIEIYSSKLDISISWNS